jgi:hypothetical protein
MRRLLQTCSAVIPVLLLAASSAAAAPPLQDRFPVEGTFDDPALTAACGVPVTIGFTGTFAIKVFRDGSGQTVREIDTQPGATLTYTSASGSIAVPFSGVLHAEYTEGAVVGSPATIQLTGNVLNGTPGNGRLVLSAVVVDTGDGFVFTRFVDLLTQSGNFTGEVQRICSALV